MGAAVAKQGLPLRTTMGVGKRANQDWERAEFKGSGANKILTPFPALITQPGFS